MDAKAAHVSLKVTVIQFAVTVASMAILLIKMAAKHARAEHKLVLRMDFAFTDMLLIRMAARQRVYQNHAVQRPA